MSGIVRRDTASVYHSLGDAWRPGAGEALPSCCWHCSEEVSSPSTLIPLPRVHDAALGVYHVYGCTCSPGCAKAYLLEHATFDRGQQLNVLVRMLREVYGVTDPVREAPPRPALRRFGGSFDPRVQTKAACRLLEPPFVTYCMLVEEQTPSRTPGVSTSLPEEDVPVVEEADTLEEPHPPSLFAAYLARKSDPSAEAGEGERREAREEDAMETEEGEGQEQQGRKPPPPPRSRAEEGKRKRSPGPPLAGPMAKFCSRPNKPA